MGGGRFDGPGGRCRLQVQDAGPDQTTGVIVIDTVHNALSDERQATATVQRVRVQTQAFPSAALYPILRVSSTREPS